MICSKCGASVSDAVKFCPQCGQPMPSVQAGADRNEAHQLPVGTLLRGRYQVGKVLGQGGFGITYLGYDTLMETQVAIKEFFPGGVVSRDCSQSLSVRCLTQRLDAHYQSNRARFLREAKALVKFKNIPEVVDILDFVEENNTAYIIMEYVHGMSLAKYIAARGGRLSVEETFNILTPVMRALAAVHQGGIVHRDIAPDNIILHPMGGAKLLDFGAVREMESADADAPLAKSTEAILKHGFAPIEQYNSRGGLGPWTDVYAMCATVYFCLTGTVPPEVSLRVSEGRHPDFGSIPGLEGHQKQALEKGMALVARERHQDMSQLLTALTPPTLAHPVPPVQAQSPVQPPIQAQMPVQAPVQHQQIPVQAPIQHQQMPGQQPPVQPFIPGQAPVQPSKPRKKLPFILAGVGAAVVAVVLIVVLFLNRPVVLGEEFTYEPYGGRLYSAVIFRYTGTGTDRYTELTGSENALDVWDLVNELKIRKVRGQDEDQALKDIKLGPHIALQLWSTSQNDCLDLRVTKDGRLYFETSQPFFFEGGEEIYAALEELLRTDDDEISLSNCIPDKNWVNMTIYFFEEDGTELWNVGTEVPALIGECVTDLRSQKIAFGEGFYGGPQGRWMRVEFWDAQGGVYSFVVDTEGRSLFVADGTLYGTRSDWLYPYLTNVMVYLIENP